LRFSPARTQLFSTVLKLLSVSLRLSFHSPSSLPRTFLPFPLDSSLQLMFFSTKFSLHSFYCFAIAVVPCRIFVFSLLECVLERGQVFSFSHQMFSSPPCLVPFSQFVSRGRPGLAGSSPDTQHSRSVPCPRPGGLNLDKSYPGI